MSVSSDISRIDSSRTHSAGPKATSGFQPLDNLLQGLRLGDNVVWQVERLEDYQYFAVPFVENAVAQGRKCHYFRFAPHRPILEPRQGLQIIELDPSAGFDSFCSELQQIIRDAGQGAFYVLDNLSALVEQWATDELLANFFQATCPFLFQLQTVTYFALLRGRHTHGTVARIRDTTQVLIDLYYSHGSLYLHPLKVWDRYSPQMFLPHLVSGESWTPVYHSAEAAAVSQSAWQSPLHKSTSFIAPWETVYARLLQYHASGSDPSLHAAEIAALKQELCRMMFGHQSQFNRLAELYFSAEDLLNIRERLIGSGRIGGKAAGMLLARRILTDCQSTVDFGEVLEPHDSFYIGSDVFFTFLVDNDLFRMRLDLSRTSHFSHEEFEELEKDFLAGTFPTEIIEQFREILDYFGQAPIIVRSSSLLEDSFGNSFAGKYRSEFCVNQGRPEDRLAAFVKAVKLVYASTLSPDALSYRRNRRLGDAEEQMAVLVQRVSGSVHDHYFFPTLAGVAFSRNLYAWTDRIDPKQGMIRLVLGLGTHAVNRVGGDYPRMIALSHPGLRPEVGAKIAKYSQRQVEVLDLETNELTTISLAGLMERQDYPKKHLLLSFLRDGNIEDPISSRMEGDSRQTVLTFNNLLRQTQFIPVMREMLGQLERAYADPVDTEFTASLHEGEKIVLNLLQCRPMMIPGAETSVTLPLDLPQERVLFRADRLICGGVVPNIRFVVYISPQKYAALADTQRKRSLGRVVGGLNKLLGGAKEKLLMMGPGRWGSSNLDLGINVSYADIDRVAVLVEMACEADGHVPEISYGTHFFQDLVEGEVIYLPVYPDDPKAEFNHRFFHETQNALNQLLPGVEAFTDILQVVDLPAATGGLSAEVVADARSRTALCYLRSA